MKAKIYTKTGDKGQTSLVGGTRVAKTDVRLEAYGTLDELNSVLGILRSLLPLDPTDIFFQTIEMSLQSVQNNLFNIGSHLACEDAAIALPGLSGGAINGLEKEMDRWESELPGLKNFILPGGSPAAAHAHLARTVCRRGERSCLRLAEVASVDADHLIYLNRLSDWLFLLGRKLNHHLERPDLPWHKG